MFICTTCGYGSVSWIGRCPDCNQWNTFKETNENSASDSKLVKEITLTQFSKVKPLTKNRTKTGFFEFDRVLGEGFVAGEVILLTGEPGVGKSTMLLQVLSNLKILYISGEESAEQIKERAERLKIRLNDLYFSNDLQIEGIVKTLETSKIQFDALVVDSIQTIYSKDINSAPGNISQLKETMAKLIFLAKKKKLTVFVIGHITKEGEAAGPKTLEHLVDCVLSFEGEKISNFRLLRASKNRFGPTDEVGIFEMKPHGLAEVSNPLIFLNDKNDASPGKAIIAVTEGKRTLFFEIQTLAVPSFLPIPRRVVHGLDYNKVLLLIAVIKRHIGLSLDKYDIYVNIIGGMEVKSPAADLGFVVSLISSVRNIAIADNSLFIGEVGLLGELRKTAAEEKIVKEAKRLGFKKIYSSMNTDNIKLLKNSLF